MIPKFEFFLLTVVSNHHNYYFSERKLHLSPRKLHSGLLSEQSFQRCHPLNMQTPQSTDQSFWQAALLRGVLCITQRRGLSAHSVLGDYFRRKPNQLGKSSPIFTKWTRLKLLCRSLGILTCESCVILLFSVGIPLSC